MLFQIIKKLFNGSVGYYLSEKWTKLWQSCLRVNLYYYSRFKSYITDIYNNKFYKTKMLEFVKYIVNSNNYILTSKNIKNKELIKYFENRIDNN